MSGCDLILNRVPSVSDFSASHHWPCCDRHLHLRVACARFQGAILQTSNLRQRRQKNTFNAIMRNSRNGINADLVQNGDKRGSFPQCR
jgi:hypothetical protein